MRYTLLSVGKSKGSDISAAIDTYCKRLKTPLTIEEIDLKGIKNPIELNRLENEKIRSLIPPSSYVVILDSEGKLFDSIGFSQKIQEIMNFSHKDICFIIGGADGLDQVTKNLADISISFGRLTWPHLLARVMLLEQLYRAQQILAGHPYHKA